MAHQQKNRALGCGFFLSEAELRRIKKDESKASARYFKERKYGIEAIEELQTTVRANKTTIEEHKKGQ